MLIKYLGPSPHVNIEPYGQHRKGETREYPDEFAVELLSTSSRQQFEPVTGDGTIAITPPPEKMTVPALKDLLDRLGVGFPANAKKADLVALVETATAGKGVVNGLLH